MNIVAGRECNPYQVSSSDPTHIIMDLVFDGNSEYVAHALRKTGILREKKIRFVTARDLIECCKQIK